MQTTLSIMSDDKSTGLGYKEYFPQFFFLLVPLTIHILRHKVPFIRKWSSFFSFDIIRPEHKWTERHNQVDVFITPPPPCKKQIRNK